MLQNLRRYYYENKTKILRNVLIIVFFILIIQGANFLVKQTAGIKTNNINMNNQFTYGNLINFGNTTNSTNTNSSINQNTSVPNNNVNGVLGGNVNNTGNTGSSDGTNISEENTAETAISSYLDLCIAGDVEKAYNMLTEECKKVMFPTIEKFEKNYHSKIFSSDKVYTIEDYYGSTYKVRVAKNMNHTGSYTTLAATEYITTKYLDGEYKVNINNYIGRENINRTATNNDITVTVNYKDVFMDYERYNITVKNSSGKTIKLNPQNSSETMYVTDHNGNKYISYSHELVESGLIMRNGSTQTLNIKYNSSYSEATNSKNQLVFEKIILDYSDYLKLDDFSNYKNFGAVRVDL